MPIMPPDRAYKKMSRDANTRHYRLICIRTKLIKIRSWMKLSRLAFFDRWSSHRAFINDSRTVSRSFFSLCEVSSSSSFFVIYHVAICWTRGVEGTSLSTWIKFVYFFWSCYFLSVFLFFFFCFHNLRDCCTLLFEELNVKYNCNV